MQSDQTDKVNQVPPEADPELKAVMKDGFKELKRHNEMQIALKVGEHESEIRQLRYDVNSLIYLVSGLIGVLCFKEFRKTQKR